MCLAIPRRTGNRSLLGASMSQFKLLTVGNPKIQKGTAFGYLTAVLHLAPASLSGYEVCPKATDGCRAACLNTAGCGGITAGKGRLTVEEIASGKRTNAIQEARIRRTRWYFEDRAAFMATLAADIRKVVKLATRLGLKPAIRLNGTSDIPWERVSYASECGTYWDNLMMHFPEVKFYDYTKRANRSGLPANYKLTFSLAEGNDSDAGAALLNGMNVAAVFHKVPASYHLPVNLTGDDERLCSVRVIDGDEHDLRFLDPVGVIVGLKAKGNAKRDTSGFVR
jgi:hypothetical protein